MQKLYAVITLIRLPNLLFIVLTQFLAHQFLILPVLHGSNKLELLSNSLLSFFLLSTLCIAAAGYIINDYFDISIDSINKPSRVTIEKFFKRRTIILWHIALNLLAIFIASIIAYRHLKFRYVLIQIVCILLLLFYSVTFKRKFLIGNLVIAILTSLTIISVAMYETHFPIWQWHLPEVEKFWMYILFAFLITLCREIVKDIEDIKGDGEKDCDTVPLRLGIEKAKWFVYISVLILFVFIFKLLSHNKFELNPILIFWILLVILPLCFTMVKLHVAHSTKQFHQVSSLLKWTTFSGILSMIIS